VGFPDAALPAESEPAVCLVSDQQTVDAKLTEVRTHAIIRRSRVGDGPDWADGRTDVEHEWVHVQAASRKPFASSVPSIVDRFAFRTQGEAAGNQSASSGPHFG
jgi:hypothetical protein